MIHDYNVSNKRWKSNKVSCIENNNDCELALGKWQTNNNLQKFYFLFKWPLLSLYMCVPSAQQDAVIINFSLSLPIRKYDISIMKWNIFDAECYWQPFDSSPFYCSRIRKKIQCGFNIFTLKLYYSSSSFFSLHEMCCIIECGM